MTVRGRGKFDAQVVVQAVDSATECTDSGAEIFFRPDRRVAPDVVLATAFAQDDGIDAYGAQRWHADLTVGSALRGRICIHIPAWYGGPRSVPAGADVRFVQPDVTPAGVQIDYPLPETVYTRQEPELRLYGTAHESATLLIQDPSARVLHHTPVAPDPKTGAWTYAASLAPIEPDGVLTLQAICATSTDGVPDGDRVRVRTAAADALVTGVVSFTLAGELPDPLIVHVFIDKVVPGAEPTNHTLLAEQRIYADGAQPVVAFAVRYDSTKVDPDATYVLSARIESTSRYVYGASNQSVPVITQGAPTRDVEIVVKQFLG